MRILRQRRMFFPGFVRRTTAGSRVGRGRRGARNKMVLSGVADTAQLIDPNTQGKALNGSAAWRLKLEALEPNPRRKSDGTTRSLG